MIYLNKIKRNKLLRYSNIRVLNSTSAMYLEKKYNFAPIREIEIEKQIHKIRTLLAIIDS